MKHLKQLFCLLSVAGLCSFASPQETSAAPKAPRIVNIVNFIRKVEPRDKAITEEVLFQTVRSQIDQLNQYGLKANFLLQYDALITPRYGELLKTELRPDSEVGGWWEITQPHVEAAGLKWRGRYPWDWHADVGFATGYTPEEREKLVDVYMSKFKEIFGAYPKSIGSWFIDAHTLGYLYDKYHITASCNCKDQIGTDGYTLWGGYWNQAYYPSRRNAYMPAQTEQGQIPVPVFRMLGSDPIYQYDSGIGGTRQSVISLEPVYPDGGGSRQWIEWFFHSMFDEPCLSFAYTQAGQENSFTWEAMKKGLEIQIPLLAARFKQGDIRVETLEESGHWFRQNYPVTPPTAVTALSDYREKNRKTVWYNSRFYRTNLLWEGESFCIRDIHLFDERMESDYLTRAGTSNQCIYTTLPLVDGCVWSSASKAAGMRLLLKQADGRFAEAKGGTPTVNEQGGDLVVTWPLNDGKSSLKLLFTQEQLEVTCSSSAAVTPDWCLQLTVTPNVELPFTQILPQMIRASHRGFNYRVVCSQGTFVDLKNRPEGTLFSLTPSDRKIVLQMKQ